MKIQNISDTSGLTPPDGYDSWQDFWEKKTGKKAEHEVKVIVKKAESSDISWYIADISDEQKACMGPYEYNSALAQLPGNLWGRKDLLQIEIAKDNGIDNGLLV